MSAVIYSLWTKPDRLVLLALSQIAAILFISIATMALGKSLSGIILLDSATTQFSYPFTIQNFMHLLFFLGVGELYVRWRSAEWELAFAAMGLLPEDSSTILQRTNLPPIRQRVAPLYQDECGYLPYLIDLGILQFMASKSVDQTVTVIDSSLELIAHRVDLGYAFSRYLVWVIPTIGFIGTVVGIAMALQQINPDAPDLRQLTASLGVAFYTTLVALVHSAILVLGLQFIQAREERSVNVAGQYVLKNLINRLYAG